MKNGGVFLRKEEPRVREVLNAVILPLKTYDEVSEILRCTDAGPATESVSLFAPKGPGRQLPESPADSGKTSENERQLSLADRENAFVQPLFGIGGVLDEDGNYVSESAQIGKGETAPRFCGTYPFDESDVTESDTEVIYIGAFVPHWGHFLLDVADRFYVFTDPRFSDRGLKIAYCSNGEKISGVFLDFLGALGVKEEALLRIDKPMRFRKVYVPEQAYMACEYYTESYRRIFEAVRDHFDYAGLVPYEKIYLSRRHFSRAAEKEFGEARIEENFVLNGFHVLYMEELSLREQIFYISRAEKIAALNGTLCHNIVFGTPRTTLYVLEKTSLPNTHQKILEEMTGCRTVYIDVYQEPYRKYPLSYGEGPFLLDARRLVPYLKKEGMTYKNPGKIEGCLTFWKYTFRCIGMKSRKNASNFYTGLYRKVSKIGWIIGPLRKLKGLFG